MVVEIASPGERSVKTKECTVGLGIRGPRNVC